MARQYDNISTFVKSIGFTLQVSKKEYIDQEKKVVVIACPKQHISTFSPDAYLNKKSAFTRGKLDNFCAECKTGAEREEKKEEYVQIVKEKTGHDLLEIDISTRKVVYRCGNCGERSNSFINNLLSHNKGHCGNCDNWDTRIPYDQLKKKVEGMGVILLTTAEEYTNNKMQLSIICSCGQPDTKVLSDIMRGKGCKDVCKSRKLAETCMDRYGVSNPSKDPAIFAKIVANGFRRKPYTMPSGEVWQLQGYEPYALEYLLSSQEDKWLERKIGEEDIKHGKGVPYFDYVDVDGSERRYFPDFMVGGLIVEVKGDRTLHAWKETNERKFQAVREKGYQLRLLLFYENGEIQEDLIVEGDLSELSFRGKGRRY